jgi:hypothetical protein
MINLVSTLEQSDSVCAIYRIKFYKMRETSDLYVNPRAAAKVEQEEDDSSYEAEGVSASIVAVEILNSTQPTG